MGWLRRLLKTFGRGGADDDAADELAFHLEERTRENVFRGMNEREARYAAQRQVGNVTLARERTADADVVMWLDSLRRDTRLAVQRLRKAPLFATVAIVSIMLGIGANTVVFTVMKHVLLDSLPVPNAKQLVIMHSVGLQEGHSHSDGMMSSFSYPQYKDLTAETSAIFDGVLARLGETITLQRGQTSERAICELVSGNYFTVLGVKPWRGRLLQASDDQKPGAHPVAVLSYARWQRSFGSDPKIVNASVWLNGHAYTIIGVTPPNFYGVQIDRTPDVFVPMMMKAQITPTWDGLMNRLDHWATLIARLRPGVSLSHAQAALSVIYPHVRDQDLAFINSPSTGFLREFAKTHVELAPGGKGYASIRESLQRPLQFIAAMAVIVLLITVVNVANLLIARAAAREREMAVRLSIGAGKGALVRQVLVESGILATAGGMLGVALAYAATPVLLNLLSSDLSQSSIDAHPDSTILLCMTGITILASLAFGLVPALQSAQTDLAGALKSEGSTGHTAGRIWLRRALVGAQVAFSLLLLTGAMLFMESLRNLQHLDPGFRTQHLITFKVDPTESGYSQARVIAFADDVRGRFRNLHTVSDAALASTALLEGHSWGGDITVEGSPLRGSSQTNVLKNQVSPDFFRTLDISLLAGRAFTDHDLNRQVAIVNRTFAKHFLAGADPVGRHFQFGTETGTPKFDWTIVGMAADSRHESVRAPVRPFVYMPYGVDEKLHSLTWYLRTTGNDKQALEEVRSTMHQADAALPLYDVGTVDEVIGKSLFAERGLATMATLFAGLAIVLATIGLYGVVAYSVARRQREFGIRIAVGATPGSILRLVLRETATIGGISVACTLPFVFASGGLIRSSLYAVRPDDPAINASAVLLLLGVAIAAGLIPARHAARINAQTALRGE